MNWINMERQPHQNKHKISLVLENKSLAVQPGHVSLLRAEITDNHKSFTSLSPLQPDLYKFSLELLEKMRKVAANSTDLHSRLQWSSACPRACWVEWNVSKE